MPTFRSREISVLVDMAGCPNRCRHCWLGCPPNRRVSEETFRWVVQQFREWVYQGEQEPFANPLNAMTWYREPDFASNYRELYELEKELNGGKATRFELLSIWRLARDESYAKWAYDVGVSDKGAGEGTQSCQITFFGMEKTTDYFTRRRGSFRDNLVATERLLEVGIKPRWQLFLTKLIIPELNDLLRLVESMNLEERVRDIGGEFDIFIHTPGPDGEAWNIEHLRPDVDVISQIPTYLVEKTKAHFGTSSVEKSPLTPLLQRGEGGIFPLVKGEETFGYAERDLIPLLLDDSQPYAWQPEHLAFMVTSDLDVFSNIAELTPWWRLGNLKTDGISEIMRRFENDETEGMYAHFHIPISTLADAYGRRDSRKIYHIGDLKTRLVRQWAQSHIACGLNHREAGSLPV
ncbi:hypothetical protein FJZ31_27655 [Candidatus Poribacteria bacterium]|nr:hypothetical protein [Candidatus Poribacteria bacterium]